MGETAEKAVEEIEQLPAVREGREKGFVIEVTIPIYEGKSNSGVQLNNRQAYSAWVTPPNHPAVVAGINAHAHAVKATGPCRVDSWVFSTDGVGYVVPSNLDWIPSSWIREGAVAFPPMVGIGPGREQHAHRIGEYCDMREVHQSSAMLAAFLASYRKSDEFVLVNPHFDRVEAVKHVLADEHKVLAFHKTIPGYAPTPLRIFEKESALASFLGVSRVLVKVDTQRFGLPSFKICGASYATYMELCRRIGREPKDWSEFPPGLTLTTATDGNHGRAVARMAKLLKYKSVIFVPDDMAQARIDGIESEGARVVKVHGTYDDAVAQAATTASDTTVVISDTSWPGYDRVPRDVIAGYSTLFQEVNSVFPTQQIDYVFVPCGVGALAAAACQHFAPNSSSHVVSVEPLTADCVFQSLQRNAITCVPGPHTSMMVGLNCGLPSEIALPIMKAGLTHCVRASDETAKDAMRRLAAEGIVAGETGSASLAGAATFMKRFSGNETVLILVTEGATDPVRFAEIVGKTPEQIKHE